LNHQSNTEKKGRRPAADLAVFQAISSPKRRRIRTLDELGDEIAELVEPSIESDDMNDAAFILSGLRK